MANKSPFITVEVCFVAGPTTGDQHIFEVRVQPDTGIKGRDARSMCGKEAGKIHTNAKGLVDVIETKDRNQNRPVCEKCQEKYKQHPRSPWRVWSEHVKAA